MQEPTVTKYRVPDGRLARFVEVLWYCSGQNILDGKELALPGSGMELVFDLMSPRARDSVLSGPHSKAFVIPTSPGVSRLLGVHFRAGGAFPFLPFPAGELQDFHLPLDELWGREEVERLLARLSGAAAPEAMFAILEKWLRANLVRPLARHPAVELALSELERDPGAPMARLVEKANLSQRRFIEVFRGETGLAPKLFSRLGRFQRVLRAADPERDWAEVAVGCGYFDQSHLIHEFRELCGLTPTRYLEARTEHAGHLPA